MLIQDLLTKITGTLNDNELFKPIASIMTIWLFTSSGAMIVITIVALAFAFCIWKKCFESRITVPMSNGSSFSNYAPPAPMVCNRNNNLQLWLPSTEKTPSISFQLFPSCLSPPPIGEICDKNLR